LLVTLHRSENTDAPERLSAIAAALNGLEEPVLFPIHPRSKKMLSAGGHELKPHVRVIDPLGYFEMVLISGGARMILTDSGGLQKEAYWLGVPCLTLRDETEWVETVESGWNRLVGADQEKILNAVKEFTPPAKRLSLYGSGDTARRCVDLMGT